LSTESLLVRVSDGVSFASPSGRLLAGASRLTRPRTISTPEVDRAARPPIVPPWFSAGSFSCCSRR